MSGGSVLGWVKRALSGQRSDPPKPATAPKQALAGKSKPVKKSGK